MLTGLKGMAGGLGILAKEAMPGLKRAASTSLGRYGGSMAVGAMGGYAASDEGFKSTAAGMVGGAALGMAASKGAFGSTVGKGASMLNRQARRGYQGASMYCNKGMNAIKSTLKG